MKVRDIMTQPPETCHAHTNLATASRRMKHSGTGMLVVLDDRSRLEGIVTDRDLALAIGGPSHDAGSQPVEHAMTRRVHTCHADDDLHHALAKMARTHVRRLPVLDSDGDLTGVISIDDVILWGVARGGVTPRELAGALRGISAAHTVTPSADLPAF